MQDVIVALDFLSRIFAVVLAIGWILGFLFCCWVGAWINARFERQVNNEFKALEHRFALALENKNVALAKELRVEIERLKAALATDLERDKRDPDEEFRHKARFFDKNSSLYETLKFEYASDGRLLYSEHPTMARRIRCPC